ncbi:MAG: N-acetylmuramoyl-L-alanine amidase [bacterium]
MNAVRRFHPMAEVFRYRGFLWSVCAGLVFAFSLPSLVLGQKPKIRIVYPLEDQEVAAKDSTFIFGSVTPGSELRINGEAVRVYSNGSFLAYLPVSLGRFSFRCMVVSGADTTVAERRVFIPYRMRAYPTDFLGFDTTYVYPRESSVLRPGDLLEVSIKGTPGCRAFFDIEGLAWEIPMAERLPLPQFPWGEAVFGELKVDSNFVKGIYTGIYQIQPWDIVRDAKIAFTLVSTDSDSISVGAKGRLTVQSSPVPTVAVLTEETVIARPDPGQAYAWFLPRGVKLWLTGSRGVWHRARLAEGQFAWVPEGSFQVLPPGTPVPRGVVRFVRAEGMEDRVRISVPLGERLPFHILQKTNPASLIVTLYGVWADTDWIPQDFSDPIIQDIRWRQAASGVYELEVLLNQDQQWGYDPRYDGTTLQIDIKRKPIISRSVFKNIVVCLDPGHHPDTGAVGPSGLEEREVNLAVARQLRTMLEEKGAVVVMTRESEEGISLRARPKLAAAVEADVLISIHFNALPDGVNPWRNNGSSIYYFHPMSSRLARLIHKEVLKELGLPDFGIYYANLALCRPTQMPAVLTEEAFMMIPDHEMRLAQPAFQRKCARAIFKGLEKFLKENR